MGILLFAALLLVVAIIFQIIVSKIMKKYYAGYLITKLYPGPKIYFKIGNVWQLFNKNPGKLVQSTASKAAPLC